MSLLPFDVQLIIINLLRTDKKSYLQCRCVCNIWHDHVKQILDEPVRLSGENHGTDALKRGNKRFFDLLDSCCSRLGPHITSIVIEGPDSEPDLSIDDLVSEPCDYLEAIVARYLFHLPNLEHLHFEQTKWSLLLPRTRELLSRMVSIVWHQFPCHGQDLAGFLETNLTSPNLRSLGLVFSVYGLPSLPTEWRPPFSTLRHLELSKIHRDSWPAVQSIVAHSPGIESLSLDIAFQFDTFLLNELLTPLGTRLKRLSIGRRTPGLPLPLHPLLLAPNTSLQTLRIGPFHERLGGVATEWLFPFLQCISSSTHLLQVLQIDIWASANTYGEMPRNFSFRELEALVLQEGKFPLLDVFMVHVHMPSRWPMPMKDGAASNIGSQFPGLTSRNKLKLAYVDCRLE